MATRQELLRKTISDARKELDKIEMDQLKENVKDFRPAWYKYHNCYSSPSLEDDYWWLYVHTIKMENNGVIRCMTFQKDKNGLIEIQPSKMYFDYNFDGGDYISIEKEEFDAAWEELLLALNTINV